jgi:hypothetical protein
MKSYWQTYISVTETFFFFRRKLCELYHYCSIDSFYNLIYLEVDYLYDFLFCFFALGEMEEAIYRMSFVESLLVLVVIGLWLLAVISLARKLERICNPPSIFPNYSLHTKASICPSSRRDRHSNESVQSRLPPPINFARATSEPAIDASPRATIYVRSPSETCLHVKSTSTLRMSAMSQHIPSPSALELGKNRTNTSVGSLIIPRSSSYQIRVETPQRPLTAQTLLDPKRIPSIVRRSFLDLHRRTLYSNPSSNISPIRCIVTAAGNNSNGNVPITTTTAKVPLLNKHRRANETDEDDWYRGKLIIPITILFRKTSC